VLVVLIVIEANDVIMKNFL